MADIKPFKALRPVSELVSAVSSPPYDVIEPKEAAEVIRRNPYSFLKVIKPEALIYPDNKIKYHLLARHAADNLQKMVEQKVMQKESNKCFYIYQQSESSYCRTGIVASLSVRDYQKGIIKRHEKIRVNTWQERVEHILTTKAHTGCPLLVFKSNTCIEELMYEKMNQNNFIYDFISEDGIRNKCWRIHAKDIEPALKRAFEQLESLYIADGHHRVAAAAEVMIRKAKQVPENIRKADNEYTYFPAVLIPHNQIQILGYHRLVKDLNDFSPDSFLSAVRNNFKIEKIIPNQSFLPSKKHEFGMNLLGQWYKLSVRKNNINESKSVVKQLDVSILQENILAPLLGIKDPQKSRVIDFIGGKESLYHINKEIQQGAKLAFTLYPTSIDELMLVSDNNEIMPPKSTWIEPKLRSGIFTHLCD